MQFNSTQTTYTVSKQSDIVGTINSLSHVLRSKLKH